jgi:hypothetical protein
MENLTKEEIKFLIIGLRMQLDECKEQVNNYDINVSHIYEKKMKFLYELWKKIENIGK